jgi:hypothetical protein
MNINRSDSLPHRNKLSHLLGLFLLTLPGIVPAAQFSFSTSPPVPGPHDIANNTGAAALRDNVNTGNADATYIADDRPIQGQTFTTGNSTSGYQLTAITLRHVTYGTYTAIPDIQYTIRITRPSGSTLSVIATETASVPASAPGNFPSNDGANGTGRYITFRFDTPVPLNRNTTYGFDVAGGTVRHYWETDGFFDRRSDAYPGGAAYSSGAGGVGNTALIARDGDRVFLVALSLPGAPVVTPPTISPSNQVYAGTPVTLNVSASGTPPLYYQWQWDDGFGYVDYFEGNDTNLFVDTTFLFGNYNFRVVLTNSSAAVTSAPVLLTVNMASAPIITMNTTPSSATRFTGQDVTFAASFDGTRPITYQWRKGSAPIPGATNTTLTLTDLRLSDAGSYSLFASNSVGTMSSADASLTVLTAPPPPEPGTYAYAVFTNDLVAYWRFNDEVGAPLIYDSAGSYNAANNGVTLGEPGMRSPTYPGFPPDNTAGSFNGVGSVANSGASILNGLTTFTILAWMKPTGPNGGLTGLLGQNDVLEGIYSDANGLTVWIQLNGTWKNPSTGTNGFAIGDWHLIAIVADGTNAYTYVNGGPPRTIVSGGAPTATSGDPFNIGGPVIIGYPGENAFKGLIEDVAIFKKALSRAEIDQLYNLAAGGGPPVIVFQPLSQSLYTGRTARFTAGGIRGNPPLTYRWEHQGMPLSDGGNISGTQTPSLTISNISHEHAGSYQLFVSNDAGTTPSSVATLEVVDPTGTPYETTAIDLAPIAYWRLNDTENPASSNALAHDYIGGFAGVYGGAALNGFNGVAGPRPANHFNAFEPDNSALQSGGADSWVMVPGIGLNSATATFAAWIKPNGAQPEYAGLLMTRSGGTEAGIGYGGTFEVNNANQLIYTWNDNTTWTNQSGLFIPDNKWSFVAVTIEPGKATLYLHYKDANTNDVLLSATNAIPHISESWNGPARIGGDPGHDSRTFNGVIDEVAIFNYALSPAQVLNLYRGLSPVALAIQRSGQNLILSWPQGTLQQADSLTGSWSAVSGAAPPSHTLVNPVGNKFYRVRVSQ